MLAQAGVASGFVLIFVFAALVVAVGMVGLFIKLIAVVVRGLFGPADAGTNLARYHVCGTRGCGYENPPPARYCAQCGMPLDR
jgi:hypothetical protein